MHNWNLFYRTRITDCSWKTRQPLAPKSTSKDKKDARRGMLLFHHHSSDDYQSFDSMSGCKWLMEFNPQSFTRLRQKKASPNTLILARQNWIINIKRARIIEPGDSLSRSFGWSMWPSDYLWKFANKKKGSVTYWKLNKTMHD